MKFKKAKENGPEGQKIEIYQLIPKKHNSKSRETIPLNF
jgi:hypothetical protein